MTGRLLAIESSCDETAVAVVEHGRRIVSNVVASQVALHAATGGIVPEVAARAHLRWMIPVLEEACERAGVTDWSALDAIAVTEGPGLAGSLLVGITMAKTLAWLHDLPLVPVNHLEGHIYAAWLLDPDEPERPEPAFPLVALVVSGGHTFLVEMTDHLTYRLLGQTVDDAAGEAFDKVGRLLGLPYPGGPAIAAAAAGATRHDGASRAPGWATRTTSASAASRRPRGVPSPRRLASAPGGSRPDGCRAAAGRRGGAGLGVPGVGGRRAGDQDAPCRRAPRCPDHRDRRRRGGQLACCGSGSRVVPPAGRPAGRAAPGLCTDNAAMIGAAGWWRLAAGSAAGRDLDARPSLRLVS